jgi:subtilisin family serine protease
MWNGTSCYEPVFGVTLTFPLGSCPFYGYDFDKRDTNPLPEGTDSHGTHIAGIIAAQMNGQGVVGVNPHAKIMAIKV